MAALLLTYTNSLSEQIPATILGLILDGITFYGAFDLIPYRNKRGNNPIRHPIIIPIVSAANI